MHDEVKKNANMSAMYLRWAAVVLLFIGGCRLEVDSSSVSGIIFSESVYGLRVPLGEKAEFQIPFQVKGDLPASIERCERSCSCTVIQEIRLKDLPPGYSGILPVSIDVGGKDFFSERIRIVTDKDIEAELVLCGIVDQSPQVVQGTVIIDPTDIGQDEVNDRLIEIRKSRWTSDHPLKAALPTVQGRNVNITHMNDLCDRIGTGKYEILVDRSFWKWELSDAGTYRDSESVRIVWDGSEHSDTIVEFRFATEGKHKPIPEKYFVGVIECGNGYDFRIPIEREMCQSLGGITIVRSSSDVMTAMVEELHNEFVYIHVTGLAPIAKGRFEAILEIGFANDATPIQSMVVCGLAK